MNKKTALRLAVEKLFDGGFHSIYEAGLHKVVELSEEEEKQAYNDKKFSPDTALRKMQADKLEQYFQQQADIPDGGDVVEQIYEYSKEGIAYGVFNTPKQTAVGFQKFIEDKLQQAGMEVD